MACKRQPENVFSLQSLSQLTQVFQNPSLAIGGFQYLEIRNKGTIFEINNSELKK
jgi:hypothetical protein